MKIEYHSLEGTNYPWIEEALQKKLKWVTDYEFGPEFWGRLQADLNALWDEHAVALINCKKQVLGFTYLITNSAVNVYPKV